MRSQMRVLFKLAVICLMQFMPASSLEEGSACNNFDGTTGVCKVDRQCQWALEKLKSKEIKPAQFVRCGLKGTSSIICCKDNSVQISTTLKSTILVTDFVFIEPEDSTNLNEEKSQPPTRHRNERKSEIACELIKKIQIKEFDFHIINGEGADVGEFPHMTAIGFADEIDANVFSFDCGGSLIAKNFVLTAGHCVNSKVRVPKIVRLGKVSLDASTDAGDENIPQDIPVKKIHLHPKYSSRKKYNDIALLELQNNVEYQKTVRPACLYMSGDFIDGPLLISGWGRIDAKTMEKSRWLLKATLSEVPLESCRKIYKNLGVTQLPEGLNQTQLCATNSDNADACQGDSGGPIQQKFFVNEESYYYIVGVTSFGSGCGSDVPGVYTRVAEYLDWIESIVWPQTMQEPVATVSPEIDKIELYLYGKDASENVTDFDFSQPIFRESLEKYLPFLIIPYSLLTISGCILNCAVIVLIFRKRLYFDETHGFIANLSFCHVIQSVFVLPLTLMIIIVQNWIFGQFLCFFTPMLQDTPIHVQVSTLILIAWDRLRWLSDPLKTRLPSFICSCGTWFAGIIITLPYPIYTTYIDLGLYESRYAGVGICAVKILDDKLDEYTRTLFILMFCVPAVLLSFLNIRIAKELKTPEGPLAIMMYEARSDLRRKQKLAVMSRPTFERTLSSASNTSKSKCRTNSTVSYDLYDAEMDGMLEKRLQKYLSAIFLSSFLCLIPLMILRLARMNVPETYENTMHYDFCFLFFIFIANLPTVVDPLIYLSLLLERHTKSSFWRIFLLTSKHESENIENISDSSKAYDRRSFVTDVSDNKRTDNKNTCHNKKSDRRKNREMLTPIKDSTLTSPHNMEPESPQRTKPLMFNTPKYSCENIRPPKLLRQYEESSSNASNVTYFNDNESTLKAPRKLSRSTHFEHRKLPNVSLSADNFEIESQYSSLKNSTSTIAHDIEVIELLERKRSMDLKEMLLADNYRRESNESRRQLIASSPSNFIELSPTLNVMGPIGNKSYRDPSEYDTNYYQRKKSLDTGFTSALYDDSKKDNVLLRKNSNDSRYSDIRSKSRASKYDEDRDEAESFFHKSFNSSITKNDCDIFSMNNSNKKTITPNDFASEF